MAILGIAINPQTESLGVFLETAAEGRQFIKVDPRSWDADGRLWYVDRHGNDTPVGYECTFLTPVPVDMDKVKSAAKDRYEAIMKAKKWFIQTPRWTTYWLPEAVVPSNEEDAHKVSLWGYTHDYGQETAPDPSFEEVLKKEESLEYKRLNPKPVVKERVLVGAEEYLSQQGIASPEPVTDLVIDIDW